MSNDKRTYIVLCATHRECQDKLRDIQTILDNHGVKNKMLVSKDVLTTDKVIYQGVSVGQVTRDGLRCFDFSITYFARRKIQSNQERYGFWHKHLCDSRKESPPV